MSLACGVVSDSPYTVAYVDSSAGGFSSTHLQQRLRVYGYGGGGEDVMAYVMEKVHIFKVFSVFDLLSVLYSLQYHISNQVSLWSSSVAF